MANATLTWTSNDGNTVKTYIIKGLLQVARRKQQTSVDLPFPLLDDSATLINSIFGQVRTFNGSFLLIQRSDDYTDGTGSPSTYTPGEQEKWLMNDIFQPTGFHTFVDEDGNSFDGRIEDLQVLEAGDDPVKDDVTFVFKRGLVPVAGQFSPFT